MENWNSSNKPLKQQHETKHDDSKPLMEMKTSGLSPCSSSPSSPSSSESSLELSTSRKGDPLRDLYTKSGQDTSLSASSSSPDVPNQTPQWSMISASPRGESEPMPFPDYPEWSGTNGPSPMKSPPMPNMGHPPGYDPNRIPSSIFSSKPSNPMEWSTASNESLFSIHMGNNSFSRDQFNMMYRSGELTKPEEWSNSPANPYNVPEVKSNEKKNLPPNIPSPIEVAANKEVKGASVMEEVPVKQEKILESPKIVPDETDEKNIKEKESDIDEGQHSASTPKKSDGKVVPSTEASHATSPRLSNESGNSSSSFAFPVLLNDAGKTGSLKAPSAKMERPQPHSRPESQSEMQPLSPPTPQSKPQTPRTPKTPSKQPESQPKAAATSWFSCLSCWPRCC